MQRDLRDSASGQGRGKAILVGEHFVLDGAGAVALSLPAFRTDVILNVQAELPAETVILSGPEVASLQADERVSAEAMLRRALTSAKETRGVHATVTSTVPLRRGFGSSAALAVAAVRASFALRGRAPEQTHLLRAATEVENIVHGSSSGLDPAAAMSPGAVHFRDGCAQNHIQIAKKGSLAAARWLLIDLGPGPSTAEVIGDANRARRRLGEARVRALVSRADAAAAQALLGLKTGDAALVAEAMDEAGACLEFLDVVNDQMREMMELCRRAGAMAIKQTGAGRGGGLLALASDAQIADTLRRRIAGYIEAAWILETTS